MRLEGKVAIVVGAGQTPGETIGNGRATALLYAREGARVLLVDRRIDSAEETRALITEEGGEAIALAADATNGDDCAHLAQACVEKFGRIDILQNNVGIGHGDASVMRLAEADWDHIFDVNLKTVFLASKHVLPIMRAHKSGSIVNISSVAAVAAMPLAAYKTSKAAVNALTQQMAIANAKHGIRVNAIMPGLMNTPMAIETISKATGIPRDTLIEQRDAQVPLRGKMGTAWDVAYASLFLASDEAAFVTGAILPVDGGQSVKVG
ncbi:MAG: SDR family NAD(P)-dependent oxidoreductase [Candidatus Binatia bacterium]|nr:SDR family NAD(P)-dependent oxidoreductase [Candidatus Binatia bacterium]